MGRLTIKTKLMAYPIIVHLAQVIARPSLNVMVGVGLFCRGVQFFENFTMCDLE
jgi:hypothetical protein